MRGRLQVLINPSPVTAYV